MRPLAALLLAAAACHGADLSGVWTGQYPGRNNQPVDIAFQFVQNGTRLEGKIYGDYGSTPISRGIISGDLLTFVVVAEEQAGNQINISTTRFSGRIVDGAIEVTRERESLVDAVNREPLPVRNAVTQIFRLIRLY